MGIRKRKQETIGRNRKEDKENKKTKEKKMEWRKGRNRK